MTWGKVKTQRPLTGRQREVLRLIVQGEHRGFQPTIREMCRALDISSTNAVSDHLRALERKGMIVRRNEARRIQITPKGYAAVGLGPLVKITLSDWRRLVLLAKRPSLMNWREISDLVASIEKKRKSDASYAKEDSC